MKYKKYFIVIFFLILSCTDEISKHKAITEGKIINKLNRAKGGYRLEYEYKVNNILYTGETAIAIYKCQYETSFAFKYFPVVYSTINPEKS